jgi:hypothetical protein
MPLSPMATAGDCAWREKMSYEQLKTDGFLFTQTGLGLNLLKADFGDGYGEAAVIGTPAGVRSWNVKISVLPNLTIACNKPINSQTRAAYLWSFFCASKQQGDRPFWLFDYYDQKSYLASFVDDSLSYDMLTGKLFSSGLNLRQRRTTDFPEALAGTPIIDHDLMYVLDHNGDYILSSGVF